jgi:hypothetical protein
MKSDEKKKIFKSSDEHLIAVLLTFDKQIKLSGKIDDEFVVEFSNGKYVASLLEKHLKNDLTIDFQKYKHYRDILSEL